MLSFWSFASIFSVEILRNALFLWAESFVLVCNTLYIILYYFKYLLGIFSVLSELPLQPYLLHIFRNV